MHPHTLAHTRTLKGAGAALPDGTEPVLSVGMGPQDKYAFVEFATETNIPKETHQNSFRDEKP